MNQQTAVAIVPPAPPLAPAPPSRANSPDVREFFTHLFAQCSGDVLFFSLDPTAGRPGPEHWVRGPHYDWDSALTFADQQSNAGRNVYFTPLTHLPGSATRSKATAHELPALFADVDFKDSDEATVRDHLARIGANARLSYLVASGNGFHPYALLHTPLAVTPDNLAALEAKLRAFGSWLANGKAERHDLASLLRVPGTINYPNAKKRADGYTPKPTQIEDATGKRFALRDLEDVFGRAVAAAPPKPAKTARLTSVPRSTVVPPGSQRSKSAPTQAAAGIVPPDWDARLAADPTVAAIWAGTADTTGDNSPSGYSMRLAHWLVANTSYEESQKLEILAAHYLEMGKSPKDRRSLERTLEKARDVSQPATPAPTPRATEQWWTTAQTLGDFLSTVPPPAQFLHPLILARGAITELFSPRGLGKTLYAHWLAITMAEEGHRVLLFDRDNPENELHRRLTAWATNSAAHSNLRILTRSDVPRLTDVEKWKDFPPDAYDVLILDALDSATEGVGEKDSGKPSRAIAPLLDIAHSKSGPAVLILGNTVKSGAHSRGSGVIEDRADLCFEVRDATGFTPKGTTDWWHQLPDASVASYKDRASRRTKQDRLRLAFVTSKFRLGPQPDPFLVELDLSSTPWTCRDVTDDVVDAGQIAQKAIAQQKATATEDAITALQLAIQTADHGQLRKAAAEQLLQKQGGLKRDPARALIDKYAGTKWVINELTTTGRPKVLTAVPTSGVTEGVRESDTQLNLSFTKGETDISSANPVKQGPHERADQRALSHEASSPDASSRDPNQPPNGLIGSTDELEPSYPGVAHTLADSGRGVRE